MPTITQFFYTIMFRLYIYLLLTFNNFFIYYTKKYFFSYISNSNGFYSATKFRTVIYFENNLIKLNGYKIFLLLYYSVFLHLILLFITKLGVSCKARKRINKMHYIRTASIFKHVILKRVERFLWNSTENHIQKAFI